jgi:hypothetical protein
VESGVTYVWPVAARIEAGERVPFAAGVFEALAITLARPLRRAYDEHCAEHCRPLGIPPLDCPEGRRLYGLLPAGEFILLGAS